MRQPRSHPSDLQGQAQEGERVLHGAPALRPRSPRRVGRGQRALRGAGRGARVAWGTGHKTACVTATGRKTACVTATGRKTACVTATGRKTACVTATGRRPSSAGEAPGAQGAHLDGSDEGRDKPRARDVRGERRARAEHCLRRLRHRALGLRRAAPAQVPRLRLW